MHAVIALPSHRIALQSCHYRDLIAPRSVSRRAAISRGRAIERSHRAAITLLKHREMIGARSRNDRDAIAPITAAKNAARSRRDRA